MKKFYVYIMCSHAKGTLYIGITNNIARRVYEHKNHLLKGFSDKYHTELLVYYETFESSLDAINREKQLKKWNRSWKIALIEASNSTWKDLYNSEILLE